MSHLMVWNRNLIGKLRFWRVGFWLNDSLVTPHVSEDELCMAFFAIRSHGRGGLRPDSLATDQALLDHSEDLA